MMELRLKYSLISSEFFHCSILAMYLLSIIVQVVKSNLQSLHVLSIAFPFLLFTVLMRVMNAMLPCMEWSLLKMVKHR